MGRFVSFSYHKSSSEESILRLVVPCSSFSLVNSRVFLLTNGECRVFKIGHARRKLLALFLFGVIHNEEYGTADVATKIECTKGAVKNHCNSTRKTLREIFQVEKAHQILSIPNQTINERTGKKYKGYALVGFKVLSHEEVHPWRTGRERFLASKFRKRKTRRKMVKITCSHAFQKRREAFLCALKGTPSGASSLEEQKENLLLFPAIVEPTQLEPVKIISSEASINGIRNRALLLFASITITFSGILLLLNPFSTETKVQIILTLTFFLIFIVISQFVVRTLMSLEGEGFSREVLSIVCQNPLRQTYIKLLNIILRGYEMVYGKIDSLSPFLVSIAFSMLYTMVSFIVSWASGGTDGTVLDLLFPVTMETTQRWKYAIKSFAVIPYAIVIFFVSMFLDEQIKKLLEYILRDEIEFFSGLLMLAAGFISIISFFFVPYALFSGSSVDLFPKLFLLFTFSSFILYDSHYVKGRYQEGPVSNAYFIIITGGVVGSTTSIGVYPGIIIGGFSSALQICFALFDCRDNIIRSFGVYFILLLHGSLTFLLFGLHGLNDERMHEFLNTLRLSDVNNIYMSQIFNTFIFFFLFPFLNAIWDTISLLASRVMVGKLARVLSGNEHNHVVHVFLYIAIDILLAFIFVIGLSFSFCVTLNFVKMMPEAKEFALGMISSITNKPSHPWITFMLASTLFPTIFNFVVSILSLSVHRTFPQRYVQNVEKMLPDQKGEHLLATLVTVQGLASSVVFTLAIWFSIATSTWFIAFTSFVNQKCLSVFF